MKQGKEKEEKREWFPERGRKPNFFVTKKGVCGVLKNVYARASSC
jgi:hypothetical protein